MHNETGSVARHDEVTGDEVTADRGSSRRGLLKLAAGAAAGAGVAAVVAKGSPASATAGTDDVVSGGVSIADRTTAFTFGTDPNEPDSGADTEIVAIDSTGAPDGTNALDSRSETGVGVVAAGGLAALQLVNVTTTAPTARTTAAEVGMLELDANANLWLCVQSGTPGVWRKLGGLATSGSFHPIVPARVYDSRLAAYAPNGGTPMQRLTTRVISVKDGRNAAGAVVAPDVVPAGATAVALNVTVASPTGPNYLSVAPGDATEVYASTINWPGGFDAANGTIVKLDATRQVKVSSGDQAGSTHVILDVTGYYL